MLSQNDAAMTIKQKRVKLKETKILHKPERLQDRAHNTSALASLVTLSAVSSIVQIIILPSAVLTRPVIL